MLLLFLKFIPFDLYSACGSSLPVEKIRPCSIYLFLCFVVFQLLVCQSHLLQFGIGYTCRQGLIPAPHYDRLCLLFALKNLAISVLNLCWLLGFSWWAPSSLCWLAWWGWGEALGVDSVVLGWKRTGSVRIVSVIWSYVILAA